MRRVRAAAVFLLVLAGGCAGTSATGSSGSTAAPGPAHEPGGPAGGGDPLRATPASYADCRRLSIDCEGGEIAPPCSFPEGTCTCEIHYRCSGVPPEPGERSAWREWTCREPPPERLPNGCPGREPEDGSPCDGTAAFCSYGECAFVPYECVGGTWRRGRASAPPSAAP